MSNYFNQLLLCVRVSTANDGISGMELINHTTVPYILGVPLVQAKFIGTRGKFTRLKFHVCSGQIKSLFCCSVSPLIARDVVMDCYPAQDSRFFFPL